MPTRNTNNSPAQTPYTAAELDERTKYRYLAYAGRYSVSDAGVIDHLPDVSLFANWEHTVVPRRATIANDRLTLELVEPLVIDGRPRGGRLTWGARRGVRSSARSRWEPPALLNYTPQRKETGEQPTVARGRSCRR
jgi:Lipocalin-like domain